MCFICSGITSPLLALALSSSPSELNASQISASVARVFSRDGGLSDLQRIAVMLRGASEGIIEADFRGVLLESLVPLFGVGFPEHSLLPMDTSRVSLSLGRRELVRIRDIHVSLVMPAHSLRRSRRVMSGI